MAATQNFKNHARIVPIYHVGVNFILLVNFIWSTYRLTRGFSGDSLVGFLLSIGLLLLSFTLRVQILTVQDRVIRLEMRLRFRELLTPEIAVRAAALPVKQIVALRFASDVELPGLVAEVLAGQLSEPKQIKMKVRDWQGDFLRA